MGNNESEDKINKCVSNRLVVSLPKLIYKFKPYKFTSCKRRSSRNCNVDQRTPKPRSGHRIVCDNANLYSYGGYNPKITPDDPDMMRDDEEWQYSWPLFREVWRLNLATESWIKLKCDNIPDVLASNAITLAGNVMMVFGGTGVPFGAHCSNNLYVCDVSKGENLSFVYVSAKGDAPTPEYGQAIVLHKNHLYTVGGTTGYEYSSDIHRLDLNGKTWEKVYICKGSREEPPGRYRHELAFDGNRIFVLGGGTAEDAFGFKEVAVFNLSTSCWENLHTKQDGEFGYPDARRCHSCIQFSENENRLFAFVIGGFNRDVIFKDVWRLDLQSLQWYKLPNSYPCPVYFHSSAITPRGKVYTFGGIIHKSTHRTNDVYYMWVTIPKLKEICWEALLYYNPNLDQFPKSVLFNSGIPSEYIDRIAVNDNKR